MSRTGQVNCRLIGEKKATTPEALMRSRFSAYATGQYDYILNTYAPEYRQSLSVQQLAQSDRDCQWLSLEVISSKESEDSGIVEFKAYYSINKTFCLLWEASDFICINHTWFYTTGKINQQSGEIQLGRNDPCLCQSGKKYKKCCAK